MADTIKGFIISGTPRYFDAYTVRGKEIPEEALNSLASLQGIYVNASNNFEINSAIAGAEKLNLVAAQAIQIKPGVDETGKGEAIQLDNEQYGAEATELTVKVCNGAQPKATRVVGLKVNTAEIAIDNQKCNTTEFDPEVIDVKFRNDKWNSGEQIGTTGPVYAKLKARAFDIRCYDHGGIALQVAGADGSGKENKIKFESDRTTEPGATAVYCKEGGKGLEFGTFNNLHTSLYTGDYRFKGDAAVYGVTRNTPVATSTGKIDYPTQADDFKDVINASTPRATWNDIIDAANKCKTLDETVAAEVARAALSGSVDTSVFVTKSEVQQVVASAVTDLHIDTTGLATEQWVLDKHYIDALPDGVQYIKMGKSKGNFAVDVTGKYTWELTSPKSASTVDEYNEPHVKGERVINYSNEAFYTDPAKVYYKAGDTTLLADGVTEVPKDTIVYTSACNLTFAVPEVTAGGYSYYLLGEGETSFYEDPTKFFYKCKAKKGDFYADGTPAAKDAIVLGSGLTAEEIAYYDSKGEILDEDGVTVLQSAIWAKTDIWKKSTLWSPNEVNINLETDSKIKFAGKKIETVWTIDDVDYKMDDILLSTNTLSTDAGEIAFEQKISKNGDRSGQDSEIVYTFGNNVADTTKVADFAAFKKNYNGKHTPKTDEELQAMYDAFLAEGESYEIRVKVSELLGLVARVADLEARLAALEASGVQGPQGHAGADGQQGPQGPAGANGEAGVQGPQGPEVVINTVPDGELSGTTE